MSRQEQLAVTRQERFIELAGKAIDEAVASIKLAKDIVDKIETIERNKRSLDQSK